MEASPRAWALPKKRATSRPARHAMDIDAYAPADLLGPGRLLSVWIGRARFMPRIRAQSRDSQIQQIDERHPRCSEARLPCFSAAAEIRFPYDAKRRRAGARNCAAVIDDAACRHHLDCGRAALSALTYAGPTTLAQEYFDKVAPAFHRGDEFGRSQGKGHHKRVPLFGNSTVAAVEARTHQGMRAALRKRSAGSRPTRVPRRSRFMRHSSARLLRRSYRPRPRSW